MVDWSIARQVARFAAGSDEPSPPRNDPVPHVPAAERAVVVYTGLLPTAATPKPELVSRSAWAEINLDALAGLLDPVAERLWERLGRAGPLAGALRATTGATLAAEAGLVTGYMSQRVLGQFELSMLVPERPARLLFVLPNIDLAAAALGGEEDDSFARWLALHEVTHAVQFGAVPWLREHLGGLLKSYLETMDVRMERGGAGGLPLLPSVARIVERFREGGLIALVQTKQQADLMERIQATMSVVEGYAEHVMDAAGDGFVTGIEQLRAGMERRRRSRSAPERILWRLLGLDVKMRQYEQGKRFCDEVARRDGIDGLNRVWESPDHLPRVHELARPGAWQRRVAQLPLAA